MWQQNDFKKGLKSYRVGFSWGVLIGLVSLLIIGHPIYTLPIILGLVFGAIAFKLSIKQIEKTKRDD
jgi:hypothetical protein